MPNKEATNLRAAVCLARYGYHLVEYHPGSGMKYPIDWRCKRCGADYSMYSGQHPKGVRVRYVDIGDTPRTELWDGPTLLEPVEWGSQIG